MKNKISVFGLALFLLVITVPNIALPQTDGLLWVVEKQLTTNSADQLDPSISGRYVAYTDSRGSDTDVYVYDIETGIETQIAGSGDQMLTNISGDWLVYTDFGQGNADAWAYNIQTGEKRRLTLSLANQRKPMVSGHRVVYEDDRTGDWGVYMYDLITDTETRLTDDPANQRNPAISGSIVVWEDYRNRNADIYMLNLDTGVVTQVTDSLAQETDPRIDGDIIVYFSNKDSDGDVFYYRISNGQTVAVTSGEAYERNPTISGDYIGYESFADGNSHIWIYSISLGVAERATQTPANQYLHDLSGNRLVYTDDRNGNLDIYMTTFAFQREEVIWKTETGAIYNSSPAVRADGTIYVGTYQYGTLVAINPDGSAKWVRSTGGDVYSSPALSESGGMVYLNSGSTLHAIDANSGDPIWTFNTEDFPAGSPAIGRDGTIYVGSGNKLYAINPNGLESWHYPLDLISDRVINSPVVGHDGTIYIGTEDSIFYAINPDGTLKGGQAGAVLNSTPAIGYDGTIYAKASPPNERTRDLLVAFNPDTLGVEWSVELSSTGTTISSPAIGPDGTIYVGAGHNLYAVNPNGTIKWTVPTDGRVFSSPAVGDDGVIYVGSEDGYVYMIDRDGIIRRAFRTEGPVFSSPAIRPGGVVYIGSIDVASETGYLYAIYGSSNGLASSAWPMFGHELHHTGRAGHANLILDRANIVSADTSSDCGSPPFGNLFQSFTPSAPVLAGVDLRLRVGGGFPINGYSTTIRIRSGSPSGQVLGTASTFITGPKVAGTELVISFDFMPEIVLTPGNTYVIEWISPAEGGGTLSWFASNYDSYHGGTAFGCYGDPAPNMDFIFRTYEVENTSVGGDIVVQPIDPTTLTTPVTVTFDKVITGGATFVTTSQTGSQPPSGYKPGQPPIYYDLSTTADFSGNVKVCIDYRGIQFNQEGRIKLFHYQNNDWMDITSSLDIGNDMICGLSQSLSPFAVFEPYITSSVCTATVKWWNAQKTMGTVNLSADFAAEIPAHGDMVAIYFDKIQLFAKPFSAFEPGLLPGAYWLVERGLLVRLDFKNNQLLVVTRKMNLVGLDNLNGVDVELMIGSDVAIENIMMKPAPFNMLIYRRPGCLGDPQ